MAGLMGDRGPEWLGDWDHVLSERHIVPWDKWQIPPTGFLLAITIEETPESNFPRGGRDDMPSWKAEFEVTGMDWAPLYGAFKWRYPMRGCGIAFPEPLPNMNACSGYILYRKAPSKECPLAITLTSLMIKDGIR